MFFNATRRLRLCEHVRADAHAFASAGMHAAPDCAFHSLLSPVAHFIADAALRRMAQMTMIRTAPQLSNASGNSAGRAAKRP